MHKIITFFVILFLYSSKSYGQPKGEITEEEAEVSAEETEAAPEVKNGHCKFEGMLLLGQNADKNVDLLSILESAENNEKAKDTERTDKVKIIRPSEIHRFIESLEGQTVAKNGIQFNVMYGVKEEDKLTIQFVGMPNEFKGLLNDLYYNDWNVLIVQNEMIVQKNEGKTEKIEKMTRKVTNRLKPPQQIANGIGKIGNFAQKIGARHLKAPENVQKKVKEIGNSVQKTAKYLLNFADQNWEEKIITEIFSLFAMFRLHKLAANLIDNLNESEEILNANYLWPLFSFELNKEKYEEKRKENEEKAEELLKEFTQKWKEPEEIKKQIKIFEKDRWDNVKIKFKVTLEQLEPSMFVKAFQLSNSEAKKTKNAIEKALDNKYFGRQCATIDDLRCCIRHNRLGVEIDLNDSQVESAKGRGENIFTLAFFVALCGDQNFSETGECTKKETLAKMDKLFLGELRKDKIGTIFEREIVNQQFYKQLMKPSDYQQQILTEEIMDRLKVYYVHHSLGLIADSIGLISPKFEAENECTEKEMQKLKDQFSKVIERNCFDTALFMRLLQFQLCHSKSYGKRVRNAIQKYLGDKLGAQWQAESEALAHWVLSKASAVMVQFVRQLRLERGKETMAPYIY
ncbi:hypothetical protein niasHT_032418 [Heterodera trifolii]|uniref:Uncharacterized protein n=2 Tax=Heterodera TaxID=34509 RepID=A0ABD2I398_9BILA